MTQTTEPTTEPTTSLDEMKDIIGTSMEEKNDLYSTSSLLDDEDLELELDHQLTRHTFAFHPLTKMLVVAGGMLAIVVVVAIIWNGMQSEGGNYIATPYPPTVEDKPESEKDLEKAELLSELALRQQKEQMAKLKANPPKPTVKKPESKPTQVVHSVPPPKPQPVPPPQKPSRVYSPPPQPTPPPEKPKVDPYSNWQKLSLIGSYGGEIPVFEPSTANFNQKVENSLNSNNNRTFSPEQNQVELVSQSEATPLNPIPLRDSLISTPLGVQVYTAKLNQNLAGTLSTPLVWHFEEEEEELPPAMIILDEPILAQGEKELFPANSTLIATVNPDSLSGLVKLNVTEIRLPDGSFEKIPNHSITISLPDGKPLIAKLQQVGGVDGDGVDTDTILDAMSIVGDVVDIPGTRYLHLLGRRGNRTPRKEPVTYFWYLPENIKVEIRVIKPFSVSESVEPLQLDMEAIKVSAVTDEQLLLGERILGEEHLSNTIQSNK